MSEFEDNLRSSLQAKSDSVIVEGAGPAQAAARASQRAKRAAVGRSLGAIAILGGLGLFALTQFTGNDAPTTIESAQVDDDTNATSEDGEATNAATSGVVLDESVAVSEAVSADIGYFGQRFITDDGQLISVTTKPGAVQWEPQSDQANLALKVSDSSGELSSNDFPVGVWPNSIAYHDGVLFAVTTGQGKVSEGNATAEVLRTDDEGKSWSDTTIDLPIDLVKGANGYINTTIAANDSGVMVWVDVQTWVDFESLIPGYSYETGHMFWETESGVDVVDGQDFDRIMSERSSQCFPEGYGERREYDVEYEDELEAAAADAALAEEQAAADAAATVPATTVPPADLPSTDSDLPVLDDSDYEAIEECMSELGPEPEPEVVASFTWADLGLDGPANRSEHLAFFSSDGKNFEQVAVPASEAGNNVWFGGLVSAGDRFLITIEQDFEAEYGDEVELSYQDYRPTVMSTTDGTTWTEVQLPASACGLRHDSSAVMLTYGCDNDSVMSSVDGIEWSEVDVPNVGAKDGFYSYENVSAGEAGFVLFRTQEPDWGPMEEEFFGNGDSEPTEDEYLEFEQKMRELQSERTLSVYFSENGKDWKQVELPAAAEGTILWGGSAIVGTDTVVLSIDGEDADGAYSSRSVFLEL